MPTVHRFGPYRFYFYAHENQDTREPPHIHVRSGDGEAKFWLEPVSLENSWRYTPRELAPPPNRHGESCAVAEALA